MMPTWLFGQRRCVGEGNDMHGYVASEGRRFRPFLSACVAVYIHMTSSKHFGTFDPSLLSAPDTKPLSEVPPSAQTSYVHAPCPVLQACNLRLGGRVVRQPTAYALHDKAGHKIPNDLVNDPIEVEFLVA